MHILLLLLLCLFDPLLMSSTWNSPCICSFDNAEMYAEGHSEIVMGKAIKVWQTASADSNIVFIEE